MAAKDAEVHKTVKYTGLVPAYIFAPVVVETLGAWRVKAVSLTSVISRHLSGVSREMRSILLLRQRIDIALQRENAASVLGTMKEVPQEDGEF